ncbi:MULTISPECIES: purine-nucleoside phosphorylase [unclassified Oceanispirochaeta]|uniref:purine-nucleoside phosphorylase n=1 Tax=unclassified Oceanispirochaeta TaxID=2635722 RepID=UPI000E099836|nr:MULTISPECIES: purine-nucleoside phosphorylase [unclassified Oceanispirochaeta]MBF9018299.1 purine-nucleoside phosphorylase [Oceanispirochaeta sp. M2]NPD74764.1 purine-nucleoside phosphorylase [Oceanispirochaeta sp. M1]RDG29378.1 purine-nucleoside phosphorylase [Oceanispirochaeta sp. M1]
MNKEKDYYEKLSESAEYIKGFLSGTPDLAIILGSGLGSLVENLEKKVIVEYSGIPHFPEVTVKGHEGRIVYGEMKGKKVLMFQGRFHYYEGYSMKEVTYPVYLLKLLSIPRLIVTNSCGGINKDFEPGDLMIIRDYINLMPSNPLIGSNDERLGTRFPDMSEPFNKEFVEVATKAAETLNLPYKEGVYASFMGPCYETAAEIRSMADMGADTVGMSTVPETMVANYLGLKVLGISCITNMATGIQKVKHSHERVVEIAQKSSVVFCKWVEKIIEEIE